MVEVRLLVPLEEGLWDPVVLADPLLAAGGTGVAEDNVAAVTETPTAAQVSAPAAIHTLVLLASSRRNFDR